MLWLRCNSRIHSGCGYLRWSGVLSFTMDLTCCILLVWCDCCLERLRALDHVMWCEYLYYVMIQVAIHWLRSQKIPEALWILTRGAAFWPLIWCDSCFRRLSKTLDDLFMHLQQIRSSKTGPGCLNFTEKIWRVNYKQNLGYRNDLHYTTRPLPAQL
jgi:hypothetical protein